MSDPVEQTLGVEDALIGSCLGLSHICAWTSHSPPAPPC